METKPFYLSKTLWVNVLGMIAMVIQTQTGFVIDAEVQAAILAVLNLIIRATTGSELTFGGKTLKQIKN